MIARSLFYAKHWNDFSNRIHIKITGVHLWFKYRHPTFVLVNAQSVSPFLTFLFLWANFLIDKKLKDYTDFFCDCCWINPLYFHLLYPIVLNAKSTFTNSIVRRDATERKELTTWKISHYIFNSAKIAITDFPCNRISCSSMLFIEVRKNT